MGIQAMHKDTGFLLDQLCKDWTAMEDSSQESFRTYNTGFAYGVQLWVS